MSSNSIFKFDLSHLDENLDEFRDTLNTAVDHLNKIANEPEKIFSNVALFDAFLFIGKAIHNFDVDFKIFSSKNIGMFISKLNFYIFEIRNEIRFDLANELVNLGRVKKRVERAKKKYENNERIVNALGNSFFLSMVLLRNSYDVFKEYLNEGGLKSLVQFIGDEEFIKANKKVNLNDPTENSFGLIDYIILNLAHLSTKTLNDFKDQWKNLDVTNKLLNIVKIESSWFTHVYLTIVTVSNCLDQKQLETLIDLSNFVKTITQLLLKAKRDFSNEDFNRFTRQVFINGNLIETEIHSVKDEKNVSISIKVLLDCISKILISDKQKADIYFRLNLKDCFKEFLEKGIY